MTTYADRPWTKNYDEGVPKTIDYPDIGLHDLLRKTAKKTPNRVVMTTSVPLPWGRSDSEMTYKELDEASDALAAGLIEMGVKKGDTIAILMPNVVAFGIAYYAAMKAGAVVSATNPTYPPGKLAYQVKDCDAEVMICLSMFYDVFKSVQSKTKVKTVIVANIKEYFSGMARFMFTLASEKKGGHRVENMGSGDVWLQDVLSKHKGESPKVEVTGKDLALFQYTGGTTGVSKGAVATHAALIANMYQLQAWLNVEGASPPEDGIVLGALPLFHVYGIVVILSLTVAGGGRIILIPNARDIPDVVDLIHHHKPTFFPGVPQLFNAITNNARVKSGEVSLKSITLSNSGSAPLPAAVKAAYEPLTGNGRLNEGFGMSEAPTGTHSNPTLGEIKQGSIGLPLPDMDCRIVSLDDSETDVPIGEIGELVIAGPNVMKGYHKMPDETANVLREKDGKIWLYTGDIARMDDDGYFYIVDRKKDMALIGGFNVYPASVEKTIKSIPAVFEVGVAGIAHPDKPGQEALKAWIALSPGATLTAEEVIDHCGEYLAGYEIPRRIEFVDEIPKSAVGKTLRRELVRMEAEKSG